jgi:hypothetical protein
MRLGWLRLTSPEQKRPKSMARSIRLSQTDDILTCYSATITKTPESLELLALS